MHLAFEHFGDRCTSFAMVTIATSKLSCWVSAGIHLMGVELAGAYQIVPGKYKAKYTVAEVYNGVPFRKEHTGCVEKSSVPHVVILVKSNSAFYGDGR